MPFNDTSIRWTDKNHNPVHGCHKTGSPACANCYAERVSRKFGNTEKPWTEENAEENVQIKRRYLDDRLHEPNWVFVNSMSDLFHPLVSDAFVTDLWDAYDEMPESAFQVLSKHGADNDRDIPQPPDNIMLGTSVGDPNWLYRLDWLKEQPAKTKFVSFEPVVAPIGAVDLTGIDWIIIGGESGPNHRDMKPEWALDLVGMAHEQDTPVFFKQHSDKQTETRQTLNGERIEEWPDLPNGVLPKPRKHLSDPVAP